MAVKQQLGFCLSDFKDLVPVYANINNTHVKDIKDIAHAKRNFEKSTLAGKTSD
jgi:hypothetical protein